MVSTKIRLIIFFAAKDGKTRYSQQKQDQELTMTQSWTPYCKIHTYIEESRKSLRYDLNKISYDYTVEVINEFKGLDLLDRVSKELWMEVHDIVQEVVIRTIPKKKKCKKTKWLSEEALQIAEKRREVKDK